MNKKQSFFLKIKQVFSFKNLIFSFSEFSLKKTLFYQINEFTSFLSLLKKRYLCTNSNSRWILEPLQTIQKVQPEQA